MDIDGRRIVSDTNQTIYGEVIVYLVSDVSNNDQLTLS